MCLHLFIDLHSAAFLMVHLLTLYGFFSVPFWIVIVSGLVIFFGSLMVLVLGEMNLGMRLQQKSSGPLASSHTHTT